MPRPFAIILLYVCVLTSSCSNVTNQTAYTPQVPGALILCGGGIAASPGQFPKEATQQNPIRKRFVELAGGPDADFVIIKVPGSRAPKDDRPLADRVAGTPDMQSA